MNNKKEKQVQTLDEIVKQVNIFAENATPEEDSVLVVGGVKNESRLRGIFTLVGNEQQITEIILKAMRKDTRAAQIILIAAKIFVENQIEKSAPDILSIVSDILNDNCQCPECRERRKKMGN